MSIFTLHTHVIFLYLPIGWLKRLKLFNISCLRVHMSYHVYNNLAKLLNGDLAAKIGQGIFSVDLMDRECNYSLQS